MKADYLIKLIEEYARKFKLDISQIYKDFAGIYQDRYGVNIIMQMQESGYTGMPEYLESRGIVHRYVEILNGQINMYEKGWK